jgi:hypothetical protein
MATKKKRAKRDKAVAKKVARKRIDPIVAARMDFLAFLAKADPDAPELKR